MARTRLRFRSWYVRSGDLLRTLGRFSNLACFGVPAARRCLPRGRPARRALFMTLRSALVRRERFNGVCVRIVGKRVPLAAMRLNSRVALFPILFFEVY